MKLIKLPLWQPAGSGEHPPEDYISEETVYINPEAVAQVGESLLPWAVAFALIGQPEKSTILIFWAMGRDHFVDTLQNWSES